LKNHLGIHKIHIGIGGSMGGQQLLEWAIEAPEVFEYIIPIATNAKHSPWGVAFNSSQRWCIENDATWKNNTPGAGLQGMKAARSIALLSYRNYTTYAHVQQGFAPDTEANTLDKKKFRAETYQYYQGEKLAKRFNAFSYYFLSKSMDFHDVSRDRGSLENALQRIEAKTMVISISSDLLFPPSEQQFLAENIKNAEMKMIESFYGHDGFLLEFNEIGKYIRQFIGK
jgi:homoserine O-acetyltransferase